MTDFTDNSDFFLFPWRQGNQFEPIIDGPNFIPQMLQAIQHSSQCIFLEMYLIESGTVSERFISSLLNAAERGIEVYLLLDDYGAIGLKQEDRQRLVSNNIHLAYFNQLHSHNTLLNLYRVLLLKNEHALHRNHRKLLLVDNEIAFVGGIGLTDEFDPPENSGKAWRETMLKIQGPVVTDWRQLFISSWNQNVEKDRQLIPVTATDYPITLAGSQYGRVSVNEIKHYSEIQLSLSNQIDNAKHRVWLSTAYFVPSWRIRRALKRAARTGVDVRLLLPGPITDHPAVRHISHRLYGRLLKNGVRIFEYQPRFLHSKCALCDHWVSIGSSNYDRWNLRWNLEANQEVSDAVLAGQIKQMFENDFTHSKEFCFKSWQQRSLHLRLLSWFWKQVERISQKIGR
ncbi:MAG: phosphatidylserine/phosphatidylglycerophosphate/cardiolipin synthase family protein [Gammaproteobacteria bacterium]|nr:phosphatidylserine/phosphatidylglycerophosphate/cardiolipin synthase family protein [Gammaproteobacteria bacterium]